MSNRRVSSDQKLEETPCDLSVRDDDGVQPLRQSSASGVVPQSKRSERRVVFLLDTTHASSSSKRAMLDSEHWNCEEFSCSGSNVMSTSAGLSVSGCDRDPKAPPPLDVKDSTAPSDKGFKPNASLENSSSFLLHFPEPPQGISTWTAKGSSTTTASSVGQPASEKEIPKTFAVAKAKPVESVPWVDMTRSSYKDREIARKMRQRSASYTFHRISKSTSPVQCQRHNSALTPVTTAISPSPKPQLSLESLGTDPVAQHMQERLQAFLKNAKDLGLEIVESPLFSTIGEWKASQGRSASDGTESEQNSDTHSTALPGGTPENDATLAQEGTLEAKPAREGSRRPQSSSFGSTEGEDSVWHPCSLSSGHARATNVGSTLWAAEGGNGMSLSFERCEPQGIDSDSGQPPPPPPQQKPHLAPRRRSDGQGEDFSAVLHTMLSSQRPRGTTKTAEAYPDVDMCSNSSGGGNSSFSTRASAAGDKMMVRPLRVKLTKSLTSGDEGEGERLASVPSFGQFKTSMTGRPVLANSIGRLQADGQGSCGSAAVSCPAVRTAQGGSALYRRTSLSCSIPSLEIHSDQPPTISPTARSAALELASPPLLPAINRSYVSQPLRSSSFPVLRRGDRASSTEPSTATSSTVAPSCDSLNTTASEAAALSNDAGSERSEGTNSSLNVPFQASNSKIE